MLQDAVPLAIELLNSSAMQTASANVQHVAQWVPGLWTAFAGIARAVQAAEKAGAEVKGLLNWKA